MEEVKDIIERWADVSRRENAVSIKIDVTYDPSTPPSLLAQLANDEDERVRHGVADNPHTPPETLARLAKDKSEHVRWRIGRNTSTHPHLKPIVRRCWVGCSHWRPHYDGHIRPYHWRAY